MIRLYYQALGHIDDICGQAFNIGGGIQQSLSLLELFDLLEGLLNVKMIYTQLPPRQSDQKVFVANIEKISQSIGWRPQVTAIEGVKKMIDWVKEGNK